MSKTRVTYQYRVRWPGGVMSATMDDHQEAKELANLTDGVVVSRTKTVSYSEWESE